MRKSWIAFGAVVVAIVAAIILLASRPRPATTTPPPTEPSPKPTTEAPTEPKEPAELKEPGEKAKEKEPEPHTPPKKLQPIDADAVLRDADGMLAGGKTTEAYRLLSDAVLREPTAQRANEMKSRLTKLSEEVFFSDRVHPPFTIAHQVVAGDALIKLAGKYKTTVELIRRINGLKSDILRVGQRLKIVPGGFDVAIDKSDFRLTVTKDGLWVREFKVGLGKDGTTPINEFVAGHKLREPVYFGDGKPIPFGNKAENPLGTRWITIQAEYGIHGTWEPDALGKEGSKGCVRMANPDIEWLFDLVVPGSSKISIRP